MEYTKLGNTDLELSRITFGAWAIGGWMWGGADESDARSAIDAALDNGIDSFDTAPVYGMGQSETIVGDALKGKRDKVKILTKYGLRWDTNKGEYFFDSIDNDGNPIKLHKYASKENVIQECEDSLRRLKTDYIDLYQIHWPDSTTPIAETMEAMEILISQGKIRYAGVCNYDDKQMQKADSVIDLASNQVPYSMVKKDIEQDVVPYCIGNNRGILAYSPLQRGLLTGKFSTDNIFNEGDTRKNDPYFKSQNINLINNFLNELSPIKNKYNATNSQLVINWTLEQPGISVALAGARNPDQVLDNANSLNFKLDKDDLKIINEKIKDLNEKLSLD